jgi:hypothetical protein
MHDRLIIGVAACRAAIVSSLRGASLDIPWTILQFASMMSHGEDSNTSAKIHPGLAGRG